MDGDAQDLTPMATLADVGVSNRRGPRRSNRGWCAAAIAVIAAVTFGVIARSADDGRGSARPRPHVLTTPAARALLSALTASTSTGGYEVSYDFVIEGRRKVTVSGHGQVGLNPYFLQTTSTVTGLGEVTVRTDGTKIVEQGGANYGGSLEDGQPLSGFASAVEATFGDGPGALTMLGLASPTGYLSLSADAVTGVTVAGTGMVGDTPVTYYDVVSDTEAMRQLPALTDEQLKTVADALEVLHRSGFVEAKARIAVDSAGYIRESLSTASFSDGMTMTRHMTLSRFGCIGTGPTPANPAGVNAPATGDCVTPATTVTTGPLAVSTSTSVSSSTTTLVPSTPSSQATTTTSLR